MSVWQCASCEEMKAVIESSSQEPTFCQECYDQKRKAQIVFFEELSNN